MLAHGDIGLQGGTGSCGPQEALFALRDCDTAHRVQVRFSDGFKQTVALPDTLKSYNTVNVVRTGEGDDAW